MERETARRGGATYADIEALPENKTGEIIDGELIVSPRPALLHALSASSLGALLGGPFQFGRGGPGGWWILDEPELHLGPDVLVPDLAGWRRARMPHVPDKAAVELAPDWVCEVLSPSTEYVDRRRKLAIYARRRVAYSWLINPLLQILEARELKANRWTELGVWGAEDRSARIKPFEEVELDLRLLWGVVAEAHEREPVKAAKRAPRRTRAQRGAGRPVK